MEKHNGSGRFLFLYNVIIFFLSGSGPQPDQQEIWTPHWQVGQLVGAADGPIASPCPVTVKVTGQQLWAGKRKLT
jgi:hypothetical protein